MAAVKKTLRRMERIFAFKVLYGLCFTPATSEKSLLEAFLLSPEQPENLDKEDSYAWRITFGVWNRQPDLDAAIASFSQNWRVDRMGKVEATILRIALFELLQRHPDVPPKVAINEAVELSKQYSDDKSRIFVNGILDAAAKALEDGALEKSVQRTAAGSHQAHTE
jgi:N utilization substance protein B